MLGAFVSLALPLAASAHSELIRATPADKATVVGTPDEIVLTFSDSLNKTKSSMILIDGAGAEVARAGVDPNDDTVMRLTPPTLAPAPYEIDWTSVAPDGDLLRGKLTFTVVAPSPSPTVVPTAVPSAAATATSTATASLAASPAPTPSPVASPAPAPAPTGGSGADVIIPVVVAIVLIAVLGAILLRGRRSPR